MQRKMKPKPVEVLGPLFSSIVPSFPSLKGSWPLTHWQKHWTPTHSNEQLKENHDISFSSTFYTNHTSLHSRSTKAWLVKKFKVLEFLHSLKIWTRRTLKNKKISKANRVLTEVQPGSGARKIWVLIEGANDAISAWPPLVYFDKKNVKRLQ